jgi:hypothetical protein
LPRCARNDGEWIPAFAGMTIFNRSLDFARDDVSIYDLQLTICDCIVEIATAFGLAMTVSEFLLSQE